MHLLAFGTLYTVAVSLISLWFRYIDIKFPDPLNYYGYYGYEQLRWPMAVLIVVFPVFLFLSRWMNRGIAQDPARKELRIYRWLVNLTLFITAITVIIDLISLINNFLGGELTTRFGLKVLVVLVVALGIFGYYLWHMRADLSVARVKRKGLFWGAIIVIIGSIVAGFAIVGSPATARAQKFDQQRVNDLQNMQWQIISYWQLNRVLPSHLGELQNDVNGYNLPNDPRCNIAESGFVSCPGENYEYSIEGPLTFKLCAEFETNYRVLQQQQRLDYKIAEWDHDVGSTCFVRTINPDLYPKVSSMPVPVR